MGSSPIISTTKVQLNGFLAHRVGVGNTLSLLLSLRLSDKRKRGQPWRGRYVNARTAVGTPGSCACISVATIVGDPSSAAFSSGEGSEQPSGNLRGSWRNRRVRRPPSRTMKRGPGDRPRQSTKRSKDGRR